MNSDNLWARQFYGMAEKPVLKRAEKEPTPYVDYSDVMPGQKRVPIDDEQRQRLENAAEKLKAVAAKHGIEFVITKGDKS